MGTLHTHMIMRPNELAERVALARRSRGRVGAIADIVHDPTPERFHGRCVAVTSLNPNPDRWRRQLRCLESWQRYGLPVITVNTGEELSVLDLPAGVTGAACNTTATLYDRPTQLITSLLRVGAATGLTTLLINSDIEIHGTASVLEDALSHPDRLGIGVRYNHDARKPRSSATREPWGLDAFLFAPTMLANIPDVPFGIGKPVWDYFVPALVRRSGYKFQFIDFPWLFHETHPIGWSQEEWSLGAEIMRHQIGEDLLWGTAEFRMSLNENV